MAWTKDANGKWGDHSSSAKPTSKPPTAPPSRPPRQPRPVQRVGPPPVQSMQDDISCDGTYLTSATVEEVYNARLNTVEQKRVRSSGSSSNGDTDRHNRTVGNPSAMLEEDTRSMSSMSMLFRKARGDRHEQYHSSNKPSDYANYQLDDDATIDSLSDVFGKTPGGKINAGNKQKNLPPSMLGQTNGSDRDDEEDSVLAGIIGTVADLHNQEEDPVNISDLHDIDLPAEDEENPRPLNKNNQAILKSSPSLKSSPTSHTSDAGSLASSANSSQQRNKNQQKKRMSKKKICCCLFVALIMVATAAALLYFFYFRKGDLDYVMNKVKSFFNRSNENNDNSVVGVPTEAPTFYPTYYPTEDVTISHPPTPKPTENFIDPLMEFLQDNQVNFDRDPLSPNYMAVQWLADEARYDSSGNGVSSAFGNGLELSDKLIQRFALLTLDYSLNRPNATVVAAMRQNRNKQAANYSSYDYETYARKHTVAIKAIDECLWEGVVCTSVGSKAGQVEEIDFSYSGLTGTIPPETELLKNLKKLSLAGNDIHGSIPEALYTIEKLEELHLYKNKLTGTISDKIGNWWNLTHLHLSHNDFTGSIPSTFVSDVGIRPIKYMNLYSNKLTGTIPDLRFRDITFADFGRNQFDGTLPDDIGLRWVSLRHLYLDHNKFSGTIPYSYPSVGNGRVETLVFNHNNLTGWVPGQYSYHYKLLDFQVHHNSFTGIDYQVCYENVFNGGEMVEYKADCDICTCDPFCENLCNKETMAPTTKTMVPETMVPTTKTMALEAAVQTTNTVVPETIVPTTKTIVPETIVPTSKTLAPTSKTMAPTLSI